MHTRMIASGLLGVAMFSSPVLAATTDDTMSSMQKAALMKAEAKCTSLEKQFDAAIKTHKTAAKVKEARELRAEGGRLCSVGQRDEGESSLEHALKDLGIKTNG